MQNTILWIFEVSTSQKLWFCKHVKFPPSGLSASTM